MATVSVRVPDELKERMEAHDEVNWSAVLRERLEAKLEELETRSLAHAVATSERLSGGLDGEELGEEDIADVIREFRDRRRGDRDA